MCATSLTPLWGLLPECEPFPHAVGYILVPPSGANTVLKRRTPYRLIG